MGNSASSGRGHHEETVDFGYLTPQGIYTGPRDWNQAIVTQLIVERRLAPFYRPLEDYEESWDDEQILAARKEPPEVDGGEPSRAESASSSLTRGHAKRPSAVKEPGRNPEAAIYRGAIECPICFLYYPPNINRSRCCDQAICTECFVQIKRADPTTTHLVSEPAACPYCVQENFGVVYTPPPWRAGLGSEGATPPSWPDSPKATSDAGTNPSNAMKRRRKSFGHNDPEVVSVDHIHPDWEAKLAAVRAAVQRRANRRIIMRQVGDRLIPVGVTSGRVHALPTEEGGSEAPEGNGDRGSRRARRRQQNQELSQFLGNMGLGGQDLEELMVMEAMRLSLLEHEEQQRRQQEEEAKKQREQAAAAAAEGNGARSSDSPAASSESGPTTEPAPSESSESTAQPAHDAASTPPSRTSLSSHVPHSSSPSLLSPIPSGPSADHSPGRRSGRSSPSSHSDVEAAVQTTAPTASAVTSRSSEREASDQLAETTLTSAATTEGDSGPPTLPPLLTGSIPTMAESFEPQATDQTSTRPSLADPPSFASSASSSSYNVLPSSPESSVSSKPLLDVVIPSTSAVEEDPSTPAAA
ncbi:hypothetical protein DICSQDRAFT_123867 [Dichomitus squalens LYAD-421 SS1]|uniref:RING-type domain-containing protein n=1 Tax=Dichomitus squalens TaxID=114155 RepID=A0A4Q9QE19_9APHY|nr:uncharacterized protein DICSQDRAFT_123867 [Dichomitus squalens LYAD-421 SS1]EJF65679.1 hypothetical protein DICSQDRAFT_123867 [Dichomitus squalens LYAD-421 SS1]TBU66047.1 hypothetical protein BD310DRAFT_912638 [Dichomitus squalens]